jgi:hypothetical protein
LAKYINLNEELYNEFKDCKNINHIKFYESVYEGLIKDNRYRPESDTRIRVAVRPIGCEYTRDKRQLIEVKPDFEYIYMKLDDVLIKNIIITLNPWSNELFFNKVSDLLNALDLANYIEIQR